MKQVKDTKRAKVQIGFDGKVYKQYMGPMAKERFSNEVRVLQYLEENHCHYVPRLISYNEEELSIITTNCGMIVEKISKEKASSLFKKLADEFGVRHEDPFQRNITYNMHKGEFCIIDFEFSTILKTGEGLTIPSNEK